MKGRHALFGNRRVGTHTFATGHLLGDVGRGGDVPVGGTTTATAGPDTRLFRISRDW